MKRAEAKETYRKIFIGGLQPHVTEDEIRTHFSQYGEIDSVELPVGGRQIASCRSSCDLENPLFRRPPFIVYKGVERCVSGCQTVFNRQLFIVISFNVQRSNTRNIHRIGLACWSGLMSAASALSQYKIIRAK